MRMTEAVLAIAAALMSAPTCAGADAAQEVLALERQAMDGWLKGNPEPQLAILDAQVTYIHDGVLERRLEGLAAVKEMFEAYRGIALFDGYEILNPVVQTAGDVAVLTYRLAQSRGSATTYWNGTQVYWKKKEGWRVIHSHWSAARTPQR